MEGRVARSVRQRHTAPSCSCNPPAIATLFGIRLRRLSRRQLILFELGVGLPLVIAFLVAFRIFVCLYIDTRGLPDVESLVKFQPLSIGEIKDARGEVLVELAREYRKVVNYEDLPPVLQHSILAAEDKRFMKHCGVDYLALPRVVLKTVVNVFSHRTTRKGLVLPQGGSTITQQLVRVYFLQHLTSREKSAELLHQSVLSRATALIIGPYATNKLLRKMEEIRISLWLERQMRHAFGSRRKAKEAILARYASVVYLGRGRHGFAAASEYYFGKPLSEYTEADADKAALLAGLAKAPELYAPSPGNVSAAVTRRNAVLGRMVHDGFLDAEAAKRFQRVEPVLATHEAVKTEAPSVVGAVFEELKTLASSQVGPTRLIEGQGAVVVLRNIDGAILAEVGGREVYESKRASYTDYNRATDAMRQPGSAMKPLVYLAAFQRGILDLDSPVPDQPISVTAGKGEPAKWIANYDHQFKGVMPARQALAESRNAVAIWVANQVGIPSIVRTSRGLGLKSELEPWVSTALGASEVRLVELANAYRAMASGILATPHLIDVISDVDGRVLPAPRPSDRVLHPTEYGLPLIQEGLRGVVRLPGGTAHALDSEDFPPVMGKTGTTNDYRDAWFLGSTYGPDGITVAVRVGFDDNRALGEKESGARAALPIFRDIMSKVYAKSLVGPVPRFPADIEQNIDAYLASAAQRAEEAERARQLAEQAGEPGTAPPEGLGSPPSARPTPLLGRIEPAAIPASAPQAVERPEAVPSPIRPTSTPIPTLVPADAPESKPAETTGH